jgi:hypothetical protein
MERKEGRERSRDQEEVGGTGLGKLGRWLLIIDNKMRMILLAAGENQERERGENRQGGREGREGERILTRWQWCQSLHTVLAMSSFLSIRASV